LDVGLGLVGLGWWGGVLAESVGRSGSARIVSCFARSEDARASFADRFGCRAAPSLEALLDDRDLVGVLLATPHSTHVGLIEAAAAAGKHVFVEKPLALTVAEANRAAAAAERAGVVLQVGHNRRRQPANRRIKAMIDAGDLGTVFQLEGTHSMPSGFKPNLPAWRSDPDECPFGGMTGLGVHTIDTFHYFMGPARRLTAFSARIEGFLALDTATTVVLEYGGGVLGSVSTSYFASPTIKLGVLGSEASAWNEEDGARLFTQLRTEPSRTERDVEAIDTLVDELEEFARCIRGEAEPETGAMAGVEVALVLEGMRRSVDSGCAVELDPAR
jgi:predicted dehydrogenase